MATFQKMNSVLLSLCFLAAAHAAKTHPVYKVTIVEIPGTNSGVTGTVTVFADKDGTTVGYAGSASGLAPGLEAATCTATNGCGVHIHSGTGCADSEAQGGHYFVAPVTEDPWVDARYSSDTEGNAVFADALSIGTDDLEGRAFIVHAEDGSRLGCGLLEAVADEDLLVSLLDPLTDAGVTGEVTSIVDSDTICYYGHAENLEENLNSIHASDGGEDCQDTNGCGTHVHAGTDCASSETQKGHFYNADEMEYDPWAIIGYETTSSDGFATYIGCVATGETDYEGRAFIVHANDGSRVSCGLLGGPALPDPGLPDPSSPDEDDDDEGTSAAPSSLPGNDYTKTVGLGFLMLASWVLL